MAEKEKVKGKEKDKEKEKATSVNTEETQGQPTEESPLQEGELTARMKTLSELFVSKLPAIEAVATKYLSAEKLLRVALITIRRDEKLVKCTQLSLLEALINASRLGLEVGFEGQAYLVPFRNNKKGGIYEATLIPGYRGFIYTATRSGMARMIEAHEVYEKDDFRYWYGDDPRLYHTPYQLADPGKIVAAYAVATLRGGLKIFEVAPARVIEKIREVSRSANLPGSIWKVWPEEMSRKTPVRRLFKYLPPSVESEAVLAMDNEASASLFGESAMSLMEPKAAAENEVGGSQKKGTPIPLAEVGSKPTTQIPQPQAPQKAPAPPPPEKPEKKQSPYLRVRELMKELKVDEKWLSELLGYDNVVHVIDLDEANLPGIIGKLEELVEFGVKS